jgi:Leucine Rich repeat
MQAAARPEVEGAIRYAVANESSVLHVEAESPRNTQFTPVDARLILECLRDISRIHGLGIVRCDIRDPAVLSAFRHGLPLCTSITNVYLCDTLLDSDDLDHLLPAFYNTSVTTLHLGRNRMAGNRGGQVLRRLLTGNNSLLEFYQFGSSLALGPEGFLALGQGIALNDRLQKLNLSRCEIGNEDLKNLGAALEVTNNNSMTVLDLTSNDINGADGGEQISLLLQRLLALKELYLRYNSRLGPLGASAMAPGLAVANHLEELYLENCSIGNDGVANLVPDGHVNKSLTRLDLFDTQVLVDGEEIVGLAARCTNLDVLDVGGATILSSDQQRRLHLLFDHRRLVSEAQALAGSTFSVLFRFVEKQAHCHEHGLSAIFVILQNDGDDYFHTALNRSVE